MGGVAKSLGSTFGIGPGGPTAQVSTGNSALDALGQQNGLYDRSQATNALQNYGEGNGTLADALSAASGLSPRMQTEMGNALATGAMTGSRFATDQVNSNPILGSLYGSAPDSQLSQAQDRQNFLTHNGYSLTKEDNDALGQASGNIARQYGSQENSLAQALANHGLSAAPNGAAAVQFSGLQGNKNEALASMQTQIAQQRIQNNQNTIAQNQSFLSSLGGQASNAINQQYDRQLQGANAQKSSLATQAGLENSKNAAANSATLDADKFAQANKPMNIGDAVGAGLMSSGYNIAASPGKAASSNAGKGGGLMSGLGG